MADDMSISVRLNDDARGWRRPARSAALSRFVRNGGVTIMLATLPILPARAADASAWDRTDYVAVRLIAGDALRVSDALSVLRAGIEIKLASGWKTYWRYPGDSGVPPRFDFARSDNVADITIGWPAPQRFVDDGTTSIGYVGNLILPLRVVARDPAKPVQLRLDLDYAICEKLCMPAEAKLELQLNGEASSEEKRIATAETLMPKASRIGDDSALAIRTVRREGSGPSSRVIVDVSLPAGADKVDLFAEGPTAQWALPVPELVGGAPQGTKRFAFVIDGVPPGERPEGAQLRLTAVSAERAIEAFYRLD